MRIIITAFTVVLGLGIITTQSSAQDDIQLQFPEKPNILFILADDLGYGDLSCQGATDLQTPNIDKIAKEGIRFTNFHANSTVCSPSRAALLSGKYPDLIGVPGVIRPWKNLRAKKKTLQISKRP